MFMKSSRFISLATAILALATGCPFNSTSSAAESSTGGGESHFAVFGANKVHYLTAGKGRQTILFVHGWACNGSFWREQVPAFETKAKLILIDLPGHGQSDKPQTDYSMDFFARAVLAVLRDAQEDKAILVGHSMGTPIICRVYAQAPQKVVALVAVDGLLRRPKMTAEQVEGFIGPYQRPDYREHTTRFVKAMFPMPGTEALRDRVLAEMLATPQHVMYGAMQGMFAAGEPAWDLDNVRVPVLVVNARNVMWTTEYEAYARSLSSKTDYRTIDGTGHFLMLEKPAEFNRVLSGMLQEFDLVGK